MDDIKPLFFATQIQSQMRRPQTQQIRIKKLNQSYERQSLQPYQKLKIMKKQALIAKNQFNKTLLDHHKLQLSLSKLQRKKHTTRAEFIKIYSNKKYKRFLQQQKNQYQNRSKSLHQQLYDKTKKRKLEEQLQRMLQRNEKQQKIQVTQKINKKQKQQWSQIKSRKKMHDFNWSKGKHDTIRNQHTEFVIRKSNISSLLQQRSKINYMKKINKQLSLLKQYENVIQEIGDFNISEINKFTELQNTKDKGYDTFFMTTKNTIS